MSRKDHIVAIISGLLASSHYTYLRIYNDKYEGEVEEPSVKMWKDDNDRRFHYHVVDQAIAIIDQVEREVK